MKNYKNDHSVPKICLMAFYSRVAFYMRGYGMYQKSGWISYGHAPPQSADPASLRLALCYTPFGPIYYIQ